MAYLLRQCATGLLSCVIALGSISFVGAYDEPLPTPFPERETVIAHASIDSDAAFALLQATPFITVYEDHARQVHARGQARGLRDDFLLSVGDCNTVSAYYLMPLVTNRVTLNSTDQSYLEDGAFDTVIAYYGNSFEHRGQGAQLGYNAMSIMDPFWADPEWCGGGESPLACDFRHTQAFAMQIMFGANDLKILTPASYETALRDIIEYSLHDDVLPILSTFSYGQEGINREKALVMNAVIVRLAAEYQIPLVNFWRSAQTLPDNGIAYDNAHLTLDGYNERNRLTLMLLTALHSALGKTDS